MNNFAKLLAATALTLIAVHFYFTYDQNKYLAAHPQNSKKAIVIGASSGIGKALAHVLAKNGYTVGLTARRLNVLEAMQKELPTKSFVKYMDLKKPEESMQALRELIHEMGGVDLIVINAGIGFFDTDLSWEHQKETIEVNVLGFVAMANEALKHFMHQNYGHIVGISSVAAIRPGKDAFTYGATKAFESGFLAGLRNTVRVKKIPIVVTDIQPGFVKTEMVAGAEKRIWESSAEQAAEEIYQAIAARKEHAYITKRWRLIAWALKFAPDWLIDRIS
jgi:short-subunit dehydrogenase